MSKQTRGKVKKIKVVDQIHIWGFVDKTTKEILPNDVCPYYITRKEAMKEKRAHSIFYSNTKVVKLSLTYTLTNQSKK